MTVDQNGVATYSDTPKPGAIKVVVVPENNVLPDEGKTSIKEIPINTGKSPDQNNIKEIINIKPAYSNFQIVSPKDQETIQNQPILNVEVKVEPELIKGDKMVLLLDNQEQGVPQEDTKFNIINIDRGRHQLRAKLLGRNGEVLKETNTITIFVHRASVNFPKPPT